MHNQNMWIPMFGSQSDVPPNDTTQQSLVNESKHASDTWKDPWDWNLDQQSDTQQQQSPPQQPPSQQQHYIPSYQNQGQLISGSVQNHYYKNLNGNTSDVLNQNSVSGRNTPRSEPARQTGSNYTDSFPPYANYNQNQQYPLPPRQNNTKSSYEHAQWPNEHQSSNAAYTQQRLMPQQSQKDQPPLHPPSTHPPSTHPTSTHLSSMATHNSYNWSKDDTTNLPLQCNWQNHTDTLGQGQDQNMSQEMQQPTVDNMGNQCAQPSQIYNAPIEGVNKEHSMNWSTNEQQSNEASNKSNVVSNQWHNQNRESQHQSTHLMQTNNVDDTFASWPQSGNISASHDWRHSNVQNESVHSTQWLQPSSADNSSFAQNVSQNNNSVRFAVNEWQQNSHSVDSQPIVGQDPLISNTYQSGATKIVDSISQSSYDQWYNQNTLENAWYAKDHSRPPPKQWNTPEQSVENYENIQQSSDFINVEVVAPATLKERDIYGSRDSINKETLDNDPKQSTSPKEATNIRDFREEVNNVEVLSVQQQQQQTRSHPPLTEQMPDNYEFASNDRNTFLETGELTDSHQEHEPTPPSQDDENDEVPNDIPFLREVPGQSSTIDPRRNDPTGQEHHVQTGQRLSDPRRNDPSGQEQKRNVPLLLRGDTDTLERRNDPSGRERSLPPQQPLPSRNDPSGEERYQLQSQIMMEPSETREVLGRGNEPDEVAQQTEAERRQIPGGASSNDTQLSDDRTTSGRVVTGSPPEVPPPMSAKQDQASESRNKREEAVGASLESESQGISSSSNRRDSYEDEEDEGSRNSRDESRERRREDDYYYERRRAGDNERQYNARDDFERRDVPYREDERKHHSRDDLDRHGRDDMDRRIRGKEDLDERDSRRRPDDRRRDRGDDRDPRRRDRDPRDYDARYSRDPRDREYMDRERRRDDRRSRRYEDYDIRDPYRRDYYDDPYGRSSRPSSRSSYNDRDREYYMRARDPYYAYNGYNGYDYSAHYGNNYYAYLENLRRTNPAAYSEWYHKYYANQHQQQHIARGVSNYPEDRASVHSGRSSCDDRFFPIPSACFRSPNKTLYIPHFGYSGWAGNLRERSTVCRNFNRTTGDKRTLGDMSLEDTIITSARLTPTKYSTSHAYGCFSIGSLIHVHPSYPADGERAKVDIFRVDSLLSHDPVARDLRLYPGPLINGVTHKKTIIEYCENKIKKAVINEEMIDRASYILLYELMIMLIQQNGNVVGVDIAGLLLRNKDAYPYDANKFRSQDIGRRESQISQRSGATGSDGSTQDISALSEKTETKQRKTVEQVTDEFRDTLLYGRVQEALEYAMNEGLWGHALFLASKLDKRTHASVMTRFANSLPSHDPLQTLYQLHSGRIPAIVTCVADPRWDDWRPHLAMIISNTSTNPEVNRRSITTLGDTLFARGDIHAAHFCYILAQIDFGAYGTNGVKLVLIGANHNKSYSEFFTMEAVMLTEIYEYARNLSDPHFTLVDLQTFKFDLTVKMVDCGLIEKALLYIEQIAINIANDPLKYKKSFIKAVHILGDRIKYHDPVYKDAIEDAANVTWLNRLAEIVGKYQDEQVVEDETYGSRTIENQEIHEVKHQQQQSSQLPLSSQQQWNTIQPDYNDGPTSMMEINTNEMQSDWQPLSLPTNIQDTYDPNAQYMRNVDESVQYQQSQQQDYWNQQSYYQNNYGRNESIQSNWQQQSAPGLTDQTEVTNSQQQDKWNYETEREDKTPTPEVSNCGLTSDNILDLERLPNVAGTNLLRRRNVSVKSNPYIASAFDDNTPGHVSTFFNLSNDNLDMKVPNSRKKYPKLTMSYPKILPNKVHPKDRKPRRVDPIFSKPPCSQPPVFLKCKIKKKNPSEDKEETAPDRSDKGNLSVSQTTDLDIQFSKLKLESLLAPDLSFGTKESHVTFSNEAQTLKQYCNFEEKKVMRVAPHIRRKDVICDTVDAWSYDSTGQNISESSRYKPLVFGGTYPIDLPLRFRNNNHLVDDTSAKNSTSLTYDIDMPTKCD
ncbi:SC16A protein, partial [Acromyrmex insinuator]